jgi:hypothetical protein
MREVKEDVLVHFFSLEEPSPTSLSLPEFGGLTPLPQCP